MNKLDTLLIDMVDATDDVVLITDAARYSDGGPRVLYANPAFEAMMGYCAGEILGKSPSLLSGAETDRQSIKKIRDAIRLGKRFRGEILLYTHQQSTRWLDLLIIPLKDKAGDVKHFSWTYRDITRHKNIERQLTNMALFDSLTGVLSRAAFMQNAERELNKSWRYHRPLSVIMIDIDHFKKINDEYGHAAGDNVLQIFAEAIQEVIRSTDFLGRVGGEEFALLLPDTSIKSACYLAERVRERIIKYPYLAGEMLIEVTASLGVAQLHASDDDFRGLMHRADEALYHAKHAGRNRVRKAA